LTVVFVPDQRSGKLELQYLHEFAGVNASIGHNPNPMVYFPGVFVLTVNHFGSKKHSQLALMFHLILQFLLYAYEFCQGLNHMVIIVISAIIAVLLVVCTQMYPIKVLCP